MGRDGLKKLLGADDSLDVFGVHAVGGILGALLTGVFNSPDLGGPGFVADWVTARCSQGSTSIVRRSDPGEGRRRHRRLVRRGGLRRLQDRRPVIGLRVPEEEEREGLDITSHGEAAYRM